MINSIEFYCDMSREMKALKCSEMRVKTDDMIELVTRLRQAEKDAARYRWLRDEANGVQIHGCMQLKGEDWNKAIDRVMKCK